MPLYIFGIIAAFTATIFHAWSNIFDGYFSSKVFKNLTHLVFFSALVNLIFIPIVLLVDFPKVLSFRMYSIVFLISLLDLLYVYPYYWALRRIDTSIVCSLFEIGKIFVPLFAFLFVGEHLATIQYIGFFLIILSSIFLTLDLKKLRFDKAFFFMLVVSIILTLQSVLYKYMFDQGVSWGSAVVWKTVFDIIILTPILLYLTNRKHLAESFKKVVAYKWLFLLNQFLGWAGESANTLALFLIPISIVKGITGTQSIFVLVFGVLFAKNYKHIFHEKVERKDIWKKAALLSITVIGVIFITVL